MPRQETILSDGWLIRSSADTQAHGEEISRPAFVVRDWRPASVPSTVLGTLAGEGVYDDPYVGMNLAKIPQETFRVPWWYRGAFALSDDQAGGTVLLEFDGINYAADIWLNGRCIARADQAKGAFRRFQYDVSGQVTAGENVLAVAVTPPKPGDFSTGFVDWNPPPPDRNMGLFRPVRLRFCAEVSIENPFVQSRLDLTTSAEASLTIRADLVNRSDEVVSGVLDGVIEGIQFRRDVQLQPRESRTITVTAEDCPLLRIANARIWWPHDLGKPELYEMELRFLVGSEPSDASSVRFGIREVADYRTPEGHRGFKVNGREVLIRGAGWTDDLLLADTPQTIEAELQYVRHMNLNCIRCEGVWGKDQTFYDLCDEYGILAMVGWSCHWEHEQYLGKPADDLYGGVTSPEDIELVSQSWRDQLLWLRNHPSIFVWAVASDKLPAPELERRYIDIFRQCDPTRPSLASTGGMGSEQRIVCPKELVSEVSGNSGMKMLGPYEYTPPVYWYTDSRRGGAYGFNTETSPGAVVPTLESLRKMLPAEHLWPVDDWWHFHCGLNEFTTLDCFREAIRRRYGEAHSVEEFALKAQTLNYELARPMFEAFRVNRGRATGVIQWMLNATWPKMYWQLYDWFLMPTGAFYGAKKACEPTQLVYNYGDQGVYLVNEPHEIVGWVLNPRVRDASDDSTRGLRTHPTSLTADIRIYDMASKLVLAAHVPVEPRADASSGVFRLPRLENVTTTHFLNLRLLDAAGTLISNNFYWLSTRPDVLDYQAKVKPWEYYTPSSQYADLTGLNSLAPAQVDVSCHIDENGQIAVDLANRSDRIAFFLELLLMDEGAGEPVVPVFWRDNYVSLLPGQTRTVTAGVGKPAQQTALVVRGWNVETQRRLVPLQ
ncbi:MAG: glycoside hydrolase family 2 [Phycisphaerae bacterium]|nr:glycoside hydrolase family 2 [Phycisphaerae bacterium]